MVDESEVATSSVDNPSSSIDNTLTVLVESSEDADHIADNDVKNQNALDQYEQQFVSITTTITTTTTTNATQDSTTDAVYNDDDDDDDDDDDEDNFDPYLFIAQLPSRSSLGNLAYHAQQHRLPARAADDRRPTLVLDLDETLVHCSIEPIADADFNFPVVFNDITYAVYVRQRPRYKEFLRKVAPLFEVVVFTASQQVYADALLHLLDPTGELIEHRLFRDACVNVAGNYVKDLSVLGRDLSKTIIVDNSPQTFGFQIDNGIPIESWFDDRDDDELMQLFPLLQRLAVAEDVRPVLRETFDLNGLVEQRRADIVAMGGNCDFFYPPKFNKRFSL